jgi:hypothetical protein
VSPSIGPPTFTAIEPLFRGFLHNRPRRPIILDRSLLDGLYHHGGHHHQELPAVASRGPSPPFRRRRFLLFDHSILASVLRDSPRKPSHGLQAAASAIGENRLHIPEFVARKTLSTGSPLEPERQRRLAPSYIVL